jgi:hypothetical protein
VGTPSAVGLSLLLLGGVVGGALVAWTVEPASAPVVALVGLLVYPGIVGNVAARARSSDAVIAVVTLVIGLVFASLLLVLIQSPRGSPSRSLIAIVIGLCLWFTGVLFGTLHASTRVALPGGVIRGGVAVGVGVLGMLVLALPFAYGSIVLMLGTHHVPG